MPKTEMLMAEMPKPVETVDHPAHYNAGGIEVIDFIEAQGMGEDFCAGNVLKYVSRYKHKNGLEDLKKAQWYLSRLIAWLTPKDTPNA